MVELRRVILSYTLLKRLLGNRIISIKLYLVKRFKILINDYKIQKDQRHFMGGPENNNGFFTHQILGRFRKGNSPRKSIPNLIHF